MKGDVFPLFNDNLSSFAELLKYFSGADYLIFSRVEPDAGKTGIAYKIGTERLENTLKRILSFNIFDLDYPLHSFPIEAQQLFTNNKINEFPYGLNLLLPNRVSKSLCYVIEKLGGVGKIYVMGFNKKIFFQKENFNNEKLNDVLLPIRYEFLGSCIFIYKNGNEIKNKILIEHLVESLFLSSNNKKSENDIIVDKDLTNKVLFYDVNSNKNKNHLNTNNEISNEQSYSEFCNEIMDSTYMINDNAEISNLIEDLKEDILKYESDKIKNSVLNDGNNDLDAFTKYKFEKNDKNNIKDKTNKNNSDLFFNDIISSGYFEYDLEEETGTLSDELFNIFGIKRSNNKVSKEELRTFIHPDDKKELDFAFKRLVEHGVSINLIIRLITADGSVPYTQIIANPVYNEESKLYKIVGNITDITEIILKENNEKEYRDRLRFLSESASTFLKMENDSQIFDFLAESLNELIPNSIIIVNYINANNYKAKPVNITGIEAIPLSFITKLAGVNPFEKTYRVNPKYLEIYLEGKIREIYGGLAELSGEHLNERTINSLVRILKINKVYTIGLVSHNKVFGSVHIITRYDSEIDNIDFIETLIFQASMALHQKNAEDKLRTSNNNLENEIENRTKELKESLEVLEKEIKIRKMVEKELSQAKQELSNSLAIEKELNELKSRFIDMISHEYRTPLTVILSSTDLIERYTEKDDKTNIIKHAYKIKKAVDVMTNLIENVLTIDSEDISKMELNFKIFNINKLILDIIEEVYLVDKEQHEIEFLTDSESLEIRSEPRLIRQIITNLLLNATKFSDKGKKIILTMKVENDRIKFEIIDQGCGISKDDQARMYEAFYRSKNAVGLIPGTGLGLTIVKRFVEFLDGTIEVVSEVNQGSIFKITIPYVK